MIREWMLSHVFMSSILIFGAISLLLQALMDVSLKGYVKASANMQTTRKKNLIHLKNQFEAIHEMGSQVRNVEAYVDKYLLKLRLIGFSLAAWEKVPFLAAGVVTLIAGGELFYEYINGAGTEKQVEILFAYGAVLSCLFVFYHIFGIKSKREQIQIQLVDYLENYLANRLTRNQDGAEMSGNPEADRTTVLLKGAGEGMDFDKTIPETDAVHDDSGMEEDVARLKRILKEIDERNERTEAFGLARTEATGSARTETTGFARTEATGPARTETTGFARTEATGPARTDVVAPVRIEAAESAQLDVSSLATSSMEAASDMESVAEMTDLLTEESDVELLEEFVQSFLA